MHSSLMYMMTFALLAVILSIQVQAGPIPIPDSMPEPEAAAVFEAMDPAKMEGFERAEDATARFIAKRAVTVEGGGSGATTDDAAIGSASIPDDTAEKHEAATNFIPIPPPPWCDFACEEIWQPLCAHNKLGNKKTFGNRCELDAWNCMHHFNAYVEDHKGECETK